MMQCMITILSNQYVLEANTKEVLIDLAGMCAALLGFVERSTFIHIQIQKGAKGAQKFDPNDNGVMSHAIQLLYKLRLIQKQGIKDLVNPHVGQHSTTAMIPEQQIPQLMTFTPIKIIYQFYSGQLLLRSKIQQPFQGFGIYPGKQQFQGFRQSGLFQQIQRSSGYSIQLYIDSRTSLKAYLSSCIVLQHLECSKLNNGTYQLHQHQAWLATQPFNLAFEARILSNQINNTINYPQLDH
ncbi:MAG: hypothetical protein EZS28_014588 [Streblomastix strix]|uniref:Uncharacterized protein n=1 Tax=Streblomastix strix TaxID=222440 RepID=A0A5J4W5I4_9EUKA|nr:MAG: hypothetical protein EZS28_014588 [Streblomastix strix]